MATSTGRVLFSTREKSVSNDLNQLQDLLGRDLLDVLSGQAVAGDEARSFVLHGLQAAPGVFGLSVDVLPGDGVIVRAAGAPTEDDSAARLLRNATRTSLALAAADPTNPRFDLVEIGAAEVTENQNRDIYNPVTGLFAAALIAKIARPGSQLFVTTGAPAASPTLPAFAPAASDRLPIAAVRVPAGATAITAADIVDLRPLWVPAPTNRLHGIRDGFVLEAASLVADTGSLQVRAGSAMVDGQLVRATAVLGTTLTSITDPNTTLTPNTWFYVYLFASRDGSNCRPRAHQLAIPQFEGVLVATHVVPGVDGYPSAPVAFPTGGGPSASMFGGSASSRGLYLGAVKTGSNPTQLQPFVRDGDWISIPEVGVGVSPPASPSDNVVDLAASERTPATCGMVEAHFEAGFSLDAATSTQTLRVRGVSGTIDWANFHVTPTGGVADIKQLGGCKVPLSTARTFVAHLEAGATDRWNTLVVRVSAVHDPAPRR